MSSTFQRVRSLPAILEPWRQHGHGTESGRLSSNEERVFVTGWSRPLEEATRRHVPKLRSARLLDAHGNQIEKSELLAFGREPNPDADDGTRIGTFLDVTRKISVGYDAEPTA